MTRPGVEVKPALKSLAPGPRNRVDTIFITFFAERVKAARIG
jgi:hypothetical protein